ncbi:MAG: PadR family transcriptional regulator [Gemmatimonadota bacterium]
MGDEVRTDEIEARLPLKSAWFHILLALGDGRMHGYAIRADVEARTEGRVVLWPATLYGSLRAMTAEGLIEEVDPEVCADDDPRRRYYALTALGKRLLAAETRRLEALVAAARATRALGDAG